MKKFFVIIFTIIILIFPLTASYIIPKNNPNEPVPFQYGIQDTSLVGIIKEIGYVFSKENMSSGFYLTETYCGLFEDEDSTPNNTPVKPDYNSFEKSFSVVIDGLTVLENKNPDNIYGYLLNPVYSDIYQNGGKIVFVKDKIIFKSKDNNLEYKVVYNESLQRDILVGQQQLIGNAFNVDGVAYYVNHKIHPVKKITGIAESVDKTVIISEHNKKLAIPYYFYFK